MPSNANNEPSLKASFRIALDQHPLPPRRRQFEMLELGDIIGLQNGAHRVVEITDPIDSAIYAPALYTVNVRTGSLMVSSYSEEDESPIGLFWTQRETLAATPTSLTNYIDPPVPFSIGEFRIIHSVPANNTVFLLDLHRPVTRLVIPIPNNIYGRLIRHGITYGNRAVPATGLSMNWTSREIVAVHCQVN